MHKIVLWKNWRLPNWAVNRDRMATVSDLTSPTSQSGPRTALLFWVWFSFWWLAEMRTGKPRQLKRKKSKWRACFLFHSTMLFALIHSFTDINIVVTCLVVTWWSHGCHMMLLFSKVFQPLKLCFWSLGNISVHVVHTVAPFCPLW